MSKFKVGDQIEYIGDRLFSESQLKVVTISEVFSPYYSFLEGGCLLISAAEGRHIDLTYKCKLVEPGQTGGKNTYPYPSGYAKWLRKQQGETVAT